MVYPPHVILDGITKYYPESIFITDGNGTIIYVNAVGAERLGASIEYLMHKNVRDLVAGGLYKNSTVLQAIESKKPYSATLNPDSPNPNVSHSIPILDSDGRVFMVITTNMSVEHSREWNRMLTEERKITERLRRELDYLRLKDHSSIVANSSAMQTIINMVNAIAPTDSNIVILGESGTGKDMMAHFIHERSNRSDNAFISINCAAIPESLLESELFGYEKGSFTGALSKGKIGLFEAANGGTLFLDEIGDMPLALQSKLLRTLENHEIRRVGGVKEIPIDVRIICATNVDLKSMVSEKKFREDLYYRLCVFPLQLPPLRERTEDIIPLAEHFLRTLNEKYDTDKILAPISIQTMLHHSWPGNIRELRNVIERIYVVSPGNELIFTPTPTADYAPAALAQAAGILLPEFDTLKSFLANAEQLYITQILKECNGCIGETARRLGIHRSVLYRKLHKNLP